LLIGDGLLHIADEFPEMGVLAPPSIGGTPVVLALDVADIEAMFAQAVAAGAEIRQPLAVMFWGDRHGQLEDPFGHRWESLSTCATSHTMRSWPPPHRRSAEFITDR
jgi:PhnB protein